MTRSETGLRSGEMPIEKIDVGNVANLESQLVGGDRGEHRRAGHQCLDYAGVSFGEAEPLQCSPVLRQLPALGGEEFLLGGYRLLCVGASVVDAHANAPARIRVAVVFVEENRTRGDGQKYLDHPPLVGGGG